MSLILDFGPIYTSTGNILQLEYAYKCANNGSTIVGLRYKNGVVIARENPIESKLYLSDQRISNIQNVLFTATGLNTDAIVVYHHLKNNIISTMRTNKSEVCLGEYTCMINSLLHSVTTSHGCRPIGCHFISSIKDESNYSLVGTDCSGRSTIYNAVSYGKGSARAKTELEKLNLASMELEQAIDQLVRIIYLCYDPLKDPNFEIEIAYIGVETDGWFQRVKNETIKELITKYKDLSVDTS